MNTKTILLDHIECPEAALHDSLHGYKMEAKGITSIVSDRYDRQIVHVLYQCTQCGECVVYKVIE